MQNENQDVFKNNVKYSSITFLKYIKLSVIRSFFLSKLDNIQIFKSHEIDKINKKYTPNINAIQYKPKHTITKYQINKKMKKKLKMENKFILLKKSADRPDKIRIYDTCSKYSFTLMNIKVKYNLLGYAEIYTCTFAVENKKKISARE